MLYEFAIFAVGVWAGGFVAYQFNEYLWTRAIRAITQEIPESIHPDLLAAVKRARAKGQPNG